MKHSENCQKARELALAARKDFEAKWPGFCKACNASGLVSWQESRGEFWGSPCSETVTEFCESCIGVDKCPRCGVVDQDNFTQDAVLTGDFKAYCDACEWHEGESAPEVLDEFDCGCFEEELDSQVSNVWSQKGVNF